MKILKRIAACALAAVITAGSLAVGASAASAKMKLRTVSIDKIEGTNVLWSMGDGYFSLNNSTDPNVDPDIDQIIYIGKDELESWQKTGKFAYKTVKTDFKTTDMLKSGGFTADGNYMQFATCDADRNVLKRYIVTHNEKNTEITTAYTKGSDWCYTNPDGYSVETKWDKSKKNYTVTVTAPDGKKKSKKLTYKGAGEAFAGVLASTGTGKYVAYVMWKTNQYTDNVYVDGSEDQLNQSNSFVIYGVKKNGKYDTIFKYEGDEKWGRRGAYNFGMSDCGSNFVVVWYQIPPRPTPYEVYLSDSGKTFPFDGISDKEGNYYAFKGEIIGKIYGSRAIAKVGKYNSQTETTDLYYALVDLSATDDTGYGTASSGAYQSMSTQDGKIYLVKNDKGQWGYINKKGKVLAWFDDAGPFIGDCAPVVKNGKAYLIDRNMKQVSEKIDADWVYTYGDGLYGVGKGDKEMLMTYQK